MKWIIIVSVTANLVLVGVLFRLPVHQGAPLPAAGSAAPRPGEVKKVVASRPGTTGPTPAVRFWDTLPSDPESIAAALKAAGVPAGIIRPILAAKLGQRREARRIELEQATPLQPYWRAFMPESWVQATLRNNFDLRKMDREDEQTIARLAGPKSDVSIPFYRRIFGDLPDNKLVQLMAIQVDDDEMNRSLTESALVVQMPDDARLLRTLSEEREKDIRAVLTPEEYEEFQYRVQNRTTNRIRHLADFQPNEDEFKTIYRFQKPFDDQFELDLPRNAAATATYQAAQRQLVADISQALGPERGLEYERAIDPTSKQLAQIVDQVRLPADAAVNAWLVQRDIQNRLARTLAAGGGYAGTVPQRLALQAEAFERLGLVLGQRGFELYRQQLGGWLNNLNPGQLPLVPAGRPGGAVGGPTR